MGEPSWAVETSPAVQASMAAAGGGGGGGPSDEIADRTSVITARLKTIYRKVVHPVEKKYRYDYFYESPLLTDVEFDGKRATKKRRLLINYALEVLLRARSSSEKRISCDLINTSSSACFSLQPNPRFFLLGSRVLEKHHLFGIC